MARPKGGDRERQQQLQDEDLDDITVVGDVYDLGQADPDQPCVAPPWRPPRHFRSRFELRRIGATTSSSRRKPNSRSQTIDRPGGPRTSP